MSNIPFDPRIQPARAETAPKVSADFGTANLRATERQGNTLAQISQQAGQITTAYAEKNKRADMAADEMSYRVEKIRLLQEAEVAAGRTSNAKEISQIYANAQNAIDKWTTGDDGNGNPNIRWKDQVAGIRSNANQFRVELDAAKMARQERLSKETTKAKADTALNISIANLDVDGAKSASSVLLEGGFINSEMKKDMDKKSSYKIYTGGMKSALSIGDKDGYLDYAEKLKEIGVYSEKDVENASGEFDSKFAYNIANENLARLEMLEAEGSITPTEKLEGINLVQENIGNIKGTQKPLINSRIYSMKNRAYKKEKADFYRGATKVMNGLDSGNYNEADVQAFMGIHVKDYNDLVVMAGQLKKVVGEAKGGGGSAALLAVEHAGKGYKLNEKGEKEVYTIPDAFKDIKESNSDLAPFASIILGMQMMAPDSGVNNEGLHYNWHVEENTVGWKNKPVMVENGSLLAYGNRKIGAYLGAGDKDSQWAIKKFDQIIRIQNDKETPEDEKQAKVDALFKSRARLLVQDLQAPNTQPQQEFPTVTTQSDFDSLAEGALYIDSEDGKTYRK